MKINIYQINRDRDTHRLKFLGLDAVRKVLHCAEPDCAAYDKVYSGDVKCRNLEDVFVLFQSGKPEGFNAESMVGKSKRGEVALRLFAVVGEPEDGGEPRFLRAGFKTRGCLAMTACASVICTMIEGKTFSEALAITPDDVKAAVDGVPYDKAHTTVFAVEGVRGLVGDWYYRSGITLAELNEKLPCDTSSVACLLCEHCSLRDTRLDMMVDEARAKAADA